MTGRASRWGQVMWYMEAWAAWGCSQELETRAGLGQQDCIVQLFLPLIWKLKICQEVTTLIPWLRALWPWAPSRSLIHILISGLSALPRAQNTAQGSWVPFQFPQMHPPFLNLLSFWGFLTGFRPSRWRVRCCRRWQQSLAWLGHPLSQHGDGGLEDLASGLPLWGNPLSFYLPPEPSCWGWLGFTAMGAMVLLQPVVINHLLLHGAHEIHN